MSKVYISADSQQRPRFNLPWNYHLSFQSFVYDALGEQDSERAAHLHQKPHAPPFAFSEFIHTGPWQATEQGLNCERGYWVVTTDDNKIIEAVATHARERQELTIGHTQVPVTGVDVEQSTVHSIDEQVRYKTLSPIAVSEQPPYPNTYPDWYSPDEPMWYSRVRDNVRDRMINDDWIESTDEFKLDIKDVHWTESKLLKVSEDAQIPCTRLEMTVRANELTHKFIQNRGVGEKTGLGFGAVMPTDDIPDQ